VNVLDLFSGIGGFSLGLERTGGFSTVAFCEIEPFCRRVLAKHWPEVPCYDDIRTLTAERLAADGIAVDVICGGWPCQGASHMGNKLGLADERTGLWREYARLIGEIRPNYVLLENVAAIIHRGLGDVLGSLAEFGFDAEWSIVSACSVGAPHVRQRVYVVANANGVDGRPRVRNPFARQRPQIPEVSRLEGSRVDWRSRMANPSELYGGADGVAFGLDRNHAIGNGLIPQIPELIGRAILSATDSELAPTIPRRRSCKGGAMPADVSCSTAKLPRRQTRDSPGAGGFS
jgi:DNA (cytosine-5)-methyltransferase 1